MKSTTALTLALVLATTRGAAPTYAAQRCFGSGDRPGPTSFSNLVIFSGSLSDTGNYASLVGDFPPPFYMNRNTNGPAAADLFAWRLGFDAEASLHLVGMAEGYNFAVRGSFAGQSGPNDLPAQLDAYFARTGGVADPDALYFVFIGGHDVITAILGPDPSMAEAIVDAAVEGIRTAIHRLVDAGARHLYVPTFLDISSAPFAHRYGIEEFAARVSYDYHYKFNRMLRQTIRRLHWRGVNIYQFDMLTYIDHVLNSANVLGISNVTDPAIEVLDSGTCPECTYEDFAFLTEGFPTAASHELIANALVTELIHQLNTCEKGNYHRPNWRNCW